LLEEAKVGCMLGMLLCLDRAQRVAFILGEIMECPSTLAADVLQISPAAFRKRLERARTDLSAFMNDQCGLLNPANACRCERKAKGFIEAGWVNPASLKFTAARVRGAQTSALREYRSLDLLEARAASLFREHPQLDGPDVATELLKLLPVQ
jgi:hypothetical protein